MIFRSILFIIFSLSFFVSKGLFAATTYTPPLQVSMTGSNTEVYFDVAHEIYLSGSTVSYPFLDTKSLRFSGAFYLSGAGWIDFSTGSYSVSLDCGAQTLSHITASCTLSGVAYGELIGDVVFDRQVYFDPSTGNLSGTAGSYVGVYDFSGVSLPLMPAGFLEGNKVVADHAKNLTIARYDRYSGVGAWQIHMEPLGSTDMLYAGGPYDLSHASVYRTEIIDPDGGSTVIDDFLVIPDTPSTTLGPVAGTVRESFCMTYPLSSLCPDGDTLHPTTLDKVGNTIVANGVDTYDFTFKLRDKYGNAVTDGTIRIDYTDTVRTLQIDPFAYGDYFLENCIFGTCALITSGDLHNFYDGMPSTGDIPTGVGNITYRIASRAPTGVQDNLTLSGILYTDLSGVTSDITHVAWRTPVTFMPWYTTSLSAGSIVVGGDVNFTTTYGHTTSAPSPISPTALYDISIGSNTPAAFQNFTSTSSISCAKYVGSPGSGECNWMPAFLDPVVLSTEALSFSGKYDYSGLEPPPESVNYTSYIHYSIGGINILYKDAFGSLGMAIAGATRIKILGQHNLPGISGVQDKDTSPLWNALRKKIALLSRNRSSYADVEYSIKSGNTALTDADFTTGSPEKRTIITIGGDITLTSDILSKTHPVAIIALSDENGNGGDILIDPGVTDIHASLFAEHSIKSTGTNQLYIHGTIASHNTMSNLRCPYYVSACVHPEDYNLESLRKDFLITPGTLSSSLTGKYSTIPFIIEYDGNVLNDPPPALEK